MCFDDGGGNAKEGRTAVFGGVKFASQGGDLFLAKEIGKLGEEVCSEYSLDLPTASIARFS